MGIKKVVKIDVFYDPICPWCYIGMRRLKRALAMRPALEGRLNWRPFLLNPDMPLGGMARDAYLLHKFGTEQRVRRLFGALEEHGQSESINFNFDNIDHTPSTINAHRLVRFAGNYAKDTQMVEALFKAYFADGMNIGNPETLATVGRRVGLNLWEMNDFLNSSVDKKWVVDENAKAHRLGINGVPCYLIDGQFAVQGAQAPDVLVRLIDAAQPVDDGA